MKHTLALDVYGTLFDTCSIEPVLQRYAGAQAGEVARVWREKQLEYSFLRGLTQRFRDFSICTQDALHYCNAYFNLHLTATDEAVLLDAYQHLSPFPDVQPALQALRRHGRLFALTNGCQHAVHTLLEHAQIKEFFTGVVSVADIKTYKPDPSVYTHFLRSTQSDPEYTWLVSANSFDIIGADYVGMRTIWVRRQPEEVFDPWGGQAEITVNSLTQVAEHINITDTANSSAS